MSGNFQGEKCIQAAHFNHVDDSFTESEESSRKKEIIDDVESIHDVKAKENPESEEDSDSAYNFCVVPCVIDSNLKLNSRVQMIFKCDQLLQTFIQVMML